MKLLKGDCLELMKDIPDNSIDMVLTDPPYGTTACKWDSVIPFEPMWEQLKRITKDNGAICLFGSEPFSSALRMSNIKMFKYDWIWEKQRAANFFNAKSQPLKYHEIISVFSQNKHYYNPQKYKVLEIEDILKMSKKELLNVFINKVYDKFGKIDRRKTLTDKKDKSNIYGKLRTSERFRDNGLRNPKNIIKINTTTNTNVHPTQKPIPLMEYLIKTYTNENEIVLDFTMGSGSTGVACANLNRQFIGIEQDEKYFQIARARIDKDYGTLERLTGKKFKEKA